MDAAQMLTAQEMARHCEQIVRAARQRAQEPERRGRALEPVPEPPSVTTEPAGHSPSPSGESPGPEGEAGELTVREREILAFERQWWKYAGAKEQAIRELFDMSSTRYYQLLNGLLDRPEAMRADPMLIKRLRKVRAERQRVRAARRLGIELD